MALLSAAAITGQPPHPPHPRGRHQQMQLLHHQDEEADLRRTEQVAAPLDAQTDRWVSEPWDDDDEDDDDDDDDDDGIMMRWDWGALHRNIVLLAGGSSLSYTCCCCCPDSCCLVCMQVPWFL